MKKTEREYMEIIQPLRAIKFNPNTPEKERVAADEQLKQLIAEYQADYPPITGTFRYTQQDVEAAKKAGF